MAAHFRKKDGNKCFIELSSKTTSYHAKKNEKIITDWLIIGLSMKSWLQ